MEQRAKLVCMSFVATLSCGLWIKLASFLVYLDSYVSDYLSTLRLTEKHAMQTSMVDVVRPSWISKLEPFNGMWHLSENGKPLGQFDAIVIAHNGQSFL